jgi:hypothetical protein
MFDNEKIIEIDETKKKYITSINSFDRTLLNTENIIDWQMPTYEQGDILELKGFSKMRSVFSEKVTKKKGRNFTINLYYQVKNWEAISVFDFSKEIKKKF